MSKRAANWKFYTLSAAVYSVLEDIQENESRFNQFLKFAIDGARKLNFTTMYDIRVFELDMSPWKTITIPEEIVDWTKIGIRCGDQIKLFTQSSNIAKIHDKTEDCKPIESAPCTDEVIEFVGSNFFASGGSHYYGSVVNYNHTGYFDVDWKSRLIHFKHTVPSAAKVYLEGITDGIDYCGHTVIHPYAFKALQQYIHWQRKEHDDRYSAGEAARAKFLWEEELGECIVNNLNLSIQDIQEALRSGYRQTIKN